MSIVRFRTAAEQVAEHLRMELSRGRWSGSMPGGDPLARELRVGRNTVETALGVANHKSHARLGETPSD